MKTSLWLNVNPLALYNPIFEEEFYFDGQHNGGVYYSGNLNPYIYCYQNPIKYIDPNGKQTEVTNKGTIFNANKNTKVDPLSRGIDYSELGCVITNMLKLCILALEQENCKKQTIDIGLILEQALHLFPTDEMELLDIISEVLV